MPQKSSSRFAQTKFTHWFIPFLLCLLFLALLVVLIVAMMIPAG